MTQAVDEVAAADPSGRAGRRGLRWLTVAGVLVVAFAAGVGLIMLRHGPSVSGSTRPAGLPDRLAYVASSDQPGVPSRVYFRQGPVIDPTAADKGGGGARDGPYLSLTAGPEGDREGVRFEWSRDGRRAWILGEDGRLHIVPGALEVAPGPVRSATFSPDGGRLAVCSDRGWPPRVRVIPMVPRKKVTPSSVKGCFPRWSADGIYVAYRLPSSDPGVYRAGWLGVLNTRLNVAFRVRAGWPATWATWPGYTFSPLTAASSDGRGVLIMSPRGGAGRTLVSSDALDRIAAQPVGPVVSLAWSVEGISLAVGLSDGSGPRDDGVVVVDPRTGSGTFVSVGDGPISLSWAPGGKLLIAVRRGPEVGDTILVRDGRAADKLIDYRDASWSSDGRWILARGPNGWFAVDASKTTRRFAFPGSKGWDLAGWCCPPVGVIRTGE